MELERIINAFMIHVKDEFTRLAKVSNSRCGDDEAKTQVGP